MRYSIAHVGSRRSLFRRTRNNLKAVKCSWKGDAATDVGMMRAAASYFPRTAETSLPRFVDCCFPARGGPHFVAVLCGMHLLRVVFCVCGHASLCGMMSALAQQAARLHGETLRPLLRRRMRPGASASHGAAYRHEGGVFGAAAPMHAAAAAAISALVRS